MKITQPAILTVNAGSSSLKFAIYPVNGEEVFAATMTGLIEGLEPNGNPSITLQVQGTKTVFNLPPGEGDPFDRSLAALQASLSEHAESMEIVAIAHRIVHGGDLYADSVVLTDEVLKDLERLTPLAPLHQPNNLRGIYAFRRSYPDLPQIGCFDTGFHATQPEVERMLALPKFLRDQGIRRYGFHGLSYRYVSEKLRSLTPAANGRVLIAHLGNGASACAIVNGKSIATTMGFTALDGLIMGTRCGALDPGVSLHLMNQGRSAKEIESLLYRESGLLGISGISADMRTLMASSAPEAALAVDAFVHRLVREIGALTACMGGLDVLVFTGGIGEHDATIRARVCGALKHLGVIIYDPRNEAADGSGVQDIGAKDWNVGVYVVPTDEGLVAARDAARLRKKN